MKIFITVFATLFPAILSAQSAGSWEMTQELSGKPVSALSFASLFPGVHSEHVETIGIVVNEKPDGSVVLYNAGTEVLRAPLSKSYQYIDLHPSSVGTHWSMDLANAQVVFSRALKVKSVRVVFSAAGAVIPPTPNPTPAPPVPSPESGLRKLTIPHHEFSGVSTKWTYETLLGTYPGYVVEKITALVEPQMKASNGSVQLWESNSFLVSRVVYDLRPVVLYDRVTDGWYPLYSNSLIKIEGWWIHYHQLEVVLRRY